MGRKQRPGLPIPFSGTQFPVVVQPTTVFSPLLLDAKQYGKVSLRRAVCISLSRPPNVPGPDSATALGWHHQAAEPVRTPVGKQIRSTSSRCMSVDRILELPVEDWEGVNGSLLDLASLKSRGVLDDDGVQQVNNETDIIEGVRLTRGAN